MKKAAHISKDGKYRYMLRRTWDPILGHLGWVMLNPSTADAYEDDATIRRCIGFSKAFGYGGIVVVNLFAFRSKEPKKLVEIKDPTGPSNEAWIRSELNTVNRVIMGWGAISNELWLKSSKTRKVVREFRSKLHCLGKTKKGAPRHPLYLKSETGLKAWTR